MTKAAAGVDRKVFKAWVNECPLRVWRIDNEVPIMQAASNLGVSMTLIQLWERGVHVPSGDNMRKLVDLLGPTTGKRWAQWMNNRPMAVQE